MEFDFDTCDPRGVAAHLPELRDSLTAKLAEREAITAEIEHLRDLILLGGGLSRGTGQSVPQRSGGGRRRRASPAQDRAVQALEQASAALAGTAVGPTSLYKYMVGQGMNVPKDATVLGTNLWDAWRAGRIRRARNGVYLPLDNTGRTEVDYPITDYYYAAEQGLPVPSQPVPRRSSSHRAQPLVGRIPLSLSAGSCASDDHSHACCEIVMIERHEIAGRPARAAVCVHATGAAQSS